MKELIVPIESIPTVDQIKDVDLADPLAIYKLCLRMEMVCEEAGGIGLSAVQIGEPLKLFVVKGNNSRFTAPKQYGYFANCRYEPIGDERVISLEGCLSIRNAEGELRHFEVERPKAIRLIGQRLVYRSGKLEFSPIDTELTLHDQSIVFCHEIDHHLGVLISDIGKEVFVW